MFKWIKGRRSGDYEKFPIIINKFIIPFDIYLLKFPQGSSISPHVDEVDNFRHYRLNILLKKAESGGNFLCGKELISFQRIKLFRPDIHEHSVTKIERGTRYVLSIGWCLKQKR